MLYSHAFKTIPSAERSILQTRVHSLISVVVAHPEVGASFTPGVSRILISATVWGVIWLIIAFIFFAAGVIVGIAAFKVLFNSVSWVELTEAGACRKALRNKRRRLKSSCLAPALKIPARS